MFCEYKHPQGLNYFFFFQLNWFEIIFCSNCKVTIVRLYFQTNYFLQSIYFIHHLVWIGPLILFSFLKNQIYPIYHSLKKFLHVWVTWEISHFSYYYRLNAFYEHFASELFLNQALVKKHDWFRRVSAKNAFPSIFEKLIRKFIFLDHESSLLVKTVFLTYSFLDGHEISFENSIISDLMIIRNLMTFWYF